MSYKLFIRLKNSAETPLEWIKSYSGGKLEAFNSHVDLAAVAKDAQAIIVLVPTEDVLLTKVKLPKLSPGKLVKAIPYALEDQLTEDPASLHFAIGQFDKGQLVPVAVVNKNVMQQWKNTLTEQVNSSHSKVKVFLPDVLATPWENDTFSIFIQQNMAYVRTSKDTGFAIEKDSLFAILQLKLKRENKKPTTIKVFAPETVFTPEQAAKLGIPIEYKTGQYADLATMVNALHEPYPLNLLQGVYTPKQKKASFDQLVWIGLALAAAWLLVITIADLADYFILRHANGIIDQQLQQIYANVYPGKPITADAKSQMQKELSALRTSNTDSAFTRLLNIVGPGIGDVIKSGVTIKTMSYRNNQLILDMEGNDLTAVENLRQSLEMQGFKATLSNAERGASGLIETRLTVEEIS